ncbi:hypothetical protein AMC99_00734 [Altererythrobacter epoxidivorans]|uniref:L,D-TPase catalytic domain-containing protein n=2 Tax=Altererythrobacter epoxidivorans TaxID=361183 RepID=A0A0M4MUJ9_9SPHN|nr:hypothetical protein AMC99_00734 [Altererythrobacter epoxidivorans]
MALLGLFMIVSGPVAAQSLVPGWTSSDISRLKVWISAAPEDALPVLDTRKLDQAVASGGAPMASAEARNLALKLAEMHLVGRAGASEKRGWNIVDTDSVAGLSPMLDHALADGTLDTFFAMLRPAHAEYSALRAAYAKESDPARRLAIARNMERWRWMPRSLGSDYVLVNTAKFEADLWRGGEKAGNWRVIVGKLSTPTPVFDATITGVILNPWWEIPDSIVRESVGSLVRRNPSLARARGYVWSDGRYRQKPGPNNALGQMKLVMPNRFSVFMHDTPNKDLFNKEVRAFSHGCIRTGDAIGYAATLLEGVKTREEVDAIVKAGKTTQIDLSTPLPLYIAYFTAVSDGRGGVELLDDLYGRDSRIREVADATGEAVHMAASGCVMTGAEG